MILAVLGGSFDPVHRGHVAIVAHLLQGGLADEVAVVPAGLPPAKGPPVADGRHRLAMCALAFGGEPRARVDDREIRRAGPSYTVDTLTELAAEHPAARLRLVVGADHLAGLPNWRDPRRILELAELVVVNRPAAVGGPASAPRTSADLRRSLAAAGLEPAAVHWLPDLAQEVSSSAVRAILAAGADPADLLPPGVGAYIAAWGLYR